jgi:hypothetical protein
MAATLSQLAALEVTLGGHLGLDQCDCPEARYTSSTRRNTAEFQHDGVTSKLPCITLRSNCFHPNMTTAQRSEIENDTECRINAAHLVEAEEPDALAEPARVDRRGLLGKHPGVHAADFDLGTKADGTSRRRRWRNQPGRQRQLI